MVVGCALGDVLLSRLSRIEKNYAQSPISNMLILG